MRRLMLLLAPVAVVALIAALPLIAAACSPFSCGCDCTPDVDLPDIDMPDLDMSDPDLLPDEDGAPARETEEETGNIWVVVGPGLAILAGAAGAAYYFGFRRR